MWGHSSHPQYWLSMWRVLPPSPLLSFLFPLVPVWAPKTHLVQVDGLEAHLCRGQLRQLGQLWTPSATWGHTAGTEEGPQKTCCLLSIPHEEG